MAYFPVNVLDNAIKAMPTVKAISNTPIATFDTDIADRLVNLEVAVTATQSGSGTPSPSTPRSISGWSNCNLSVNGTTHTINFGQTVYGGSLDVLTGKLTITHLYKTFTSSDQIWYKSGSYSGSFYAYTAGLGIKSNTPFICSHAQTVTSISNYARGKCYCDGAVNLWLMPSGSELSDWYTYLDTQNANGNPVSICGELVTPIEIQLSSEEVQAIIGTNNIYADTGDIIDLKYQVTVGQAIS